MGHGSVPRVDANYKMQVQLGEGTQHFNVMLLDTFKNL